MKSFIGMGPTAMRAMNLNRSKVGKIADNTRLAELELEEAQKSKVKELVSKKVKKVTDEYE